MRMRSELIGIVDQDFAEDAHFCMPNAATTQKPFDCQAALVNWERAWSDAKKHWCCENELLGCRPLKSGVTMCEGQGYTMQQCSFVGCCIFNTTSNQCTSAVGKKVCYPEFNIRSNAGYCLSSKTTEEGILRRQEKIFVVSCNISDIFEEWTPTRTGQIENPAGFCLDAGDQTPGAAILAKECSRTDPPKPSQILDYDHKTHQLQTPSGLCLSSTFRGIVTKVEIILDICNKGEEMQWWTVYQANFAERSRRSRRK